MAYVELHARSAFSFLEGASLPEILASICAARDIPAMALLDRNGVYGSPRFHMAAGKNGIRAHVGAEIAVADEFGISHYPVLCASRTGYQNLCRLLTNAKLRSPKNTPSSATMGELEEYAEGLICLTGDEQGRRALSHKRSQQRMLEIETKLRDGMTKNGIELNAQDQIVQFISSFASYGFPESHSASFALLAYASAFLKVRYLAAFTAAILNNQPMGFYSSATLVKDAQRHGLRVRPIDVTCSQWDCSLERQVDKLTVRIGLGYVRGLQQFAAESLVYQRERAPFRSVDDLALRVPELSKANLAMLARVGALNNISLDAKMHRRDALWQVAKAGWRVGALLETIIEPDGTSPLLQMNDDERLVSDHHGTGLTTGPHPMAYRRNDLRSMGIKSAAELRSLPHGKRATVAGSVITRQRPGTAKGLIFMTLEDETGNANIIVTPDFYEKNRAVVSYERFVFVSGVVQNQDNIVHLRAQRIGLLTVSAVDVQSHDFH